MTTDDSPAQLLSELRQLGARTSAAARAWWLPLLLFGMAICGSLPFYQELRATPLVRPPGGQPVHVTVVAALGYYWQLAIPAGVAATVLWYRWRGRRVGLRTVTLPFLITGLVLGELVLLLPLLAGQSPALARLAHDTHQAGPLVIIAVLLGVLAWAERSRALALTTACYLVSAIIVTRFTNGGLVGGSTGAAHLSLSAIRLLGLGPALILLGTGAVAWLATGRARRRAAAEPTR